jgi:hypothetical protein
MTDTVPGFTEDVTPGFRERYLSVPLPLWRHLVYLGIALAVCYSFVGYYTRMALYMEQIFSADSRGGAFFFVLAVPFWMGVVLSFRQVRLLIRHRASPRYWAVLFVSHIPFIFYARDFAKVSYGLVLGVPASLLYIPFSFISYTGLWLCLAGRDFVVDKDSQ